MMNPDVFPSIVDTDIGSDVDDILALVLLAKAPEINLIGVTTVYGDTLLRARLARFVCERLERADVDIAAGERETLAGRNVWWAGHEGHGIEGLDQITVDQSIDGVTYLLRAARTHANKLDIFAIGPLTNVARAIEADPSFASSVHHLYIMGGAFWMEKPEHNIRCDPEAARIVFESGISMTVCGLDVTTQVWLREEDVKKIQDINADLGPVLAEHIRQWWEFKAANQQLSNHSGERFANNPHDPLAILPAIRPELFTFEYCDVEVGLGEEDLARTIPRNCREGGVRIASGVDVSAAEREIVSRITDHR